MKPPRKTSALTSRHPGTLALPALPARERHHLQETERQDRDRFGAPKARGPSETDGRICDIVPPKESRMLNWLVRLWRGIQDRCWGHRPSRILTGARISTVLIDR